MDKSTERNAVVATIDPDAYVSGLFSTDWVDMDDFYEVMFIAMLGTIVTTASLDLTIQEARTSGGSGAQNLSGKTLTALTSGSNDSQALINVQASDLAQGYSFVRGQMLLSVAGGDAAVVAVGSRPRHHPASDYDLASVAEIVD